MIHRYRIEAKAHSIDGWRKKEVEWLIANHADIGIALDPMGELVRWEEIKPLLDELKSLRALKRSIDESLNSGEGVYRP